jgi:2,3,4,5-tetrahydropyridine-2,6-dicarboxylate N-succinyltransferase
MTSLAELENRIDKSWANPNQLDVEAIDQAVELLDKGQARVAQPDNDGWIVNEWLKRAVLLYFRARPMEMIDGGFFEYRDKVPVKREFEEQQVRVVPPAVARYGSYLAPGVVMMPSYVNIGAYVDSGTMVDTWATVGSCAQVGKNVHLAGGVGIGGVLEPVQAAPVIVEDDAFIGSRCVVVEGARIRKGAVLGANTVITASTPIIDVTNLEPVEYRGEVPERAVVIPGTRIKQFPAGSYHLPCGLIIGYRNENTDDKVAVNQMLRDAGVGV